MTEVFRSSALCGFLLACMAAGPAGRALAQDAGEGIPVTDALVIAKCGSCHARDQQGSMQWISQQRTTPEGWQDVLKRMIAALAAS